MSKKRKKIFREQYEEKVDVDVFADDAELDALVKDYLKEQETTNVSGDSESSTARSAMERILGRMSSTHEPNSSVQHKAYSTENRTNNQIQLQPSISISECLNRVIITDKTGTVTYASTNKYKNSHNAPVDADDAGHYLSEFEYLLLIDSTPSAAFTYEEFLNLFKHVVETNKKRFIFFIDDSFNFNADDPVYCFFNGVKFYNECDKVVTDLIDNHGFTNTDVVDIFRDLVVYHGATSFIGRDAENEFDAFRESKYNSKDKICDLVMNDRFTKVDKTVENDDLSVIFGFKKFSDIEYYFPEIGCSDHETHMTVDSAEVDSIMNKEDKEKLDEVISSETAGVTNDNEPFQTKIDSCSPSGYDVEYREERVRTIVEQQEVQEEEEEVGEEERDSGIVDADPETFKFEEEKEDGRITTSPVIHNNSSNGSMILPVFTE